MKQFELKFTPENLYRHLAYDPVVITTIRGEMKADIGDVTIVNNSEIYRLTSCYKILMRDLLTEERDLWIKEGFGSYKEYLEEVRRIYGDDLKRELFVMRLCRLLRVNKNADKHLAEKISNIMKNKYPQHGNYFCSECNEIEEDQL